MDYLHRDPGTYLSHILRGLDGYATFLESFVEAGAILTQSECDQLRLTFSRLCRSIDDLLDTYTER